MESDVIRMPNPEFITNKDCGVRLFAYASALSGKEGASSSSGDKVKSGSGITGLRKELEKTKLDV